MELPKVIYLQHINDQGDDLHPDDRTWCRDKIYKYDAQYNLAPEWTDAGDAMPDQSLPVYLAYQTEITGDQWHLVEGSPGLLQRMIGVDGFLNWKWQYKYIPKPPGPQQ